MAGPSQPLLADGAKKVMTTVYGVTFIGAREQIEKQLKDKNDFAEEDCWALSAYVAKKVIFLPNDAIRCPDLCLSL